MVGEQDLLYGHGGARFRNNNSANSDCYNGDCYVMRINNNPTGQITFMQPGNAAPNTIQMNNWATLRPSPAALQNRFGYALDGQHW